MFAQTQSIFGKRYENTFVGMSNVRYWSNFTFSMPLCQMQQIQNHELF